MNIYYSLISKFCMNKKSQCLIYDHYEKYLLLLSLKIIIIVVKYSIIE